MTPADLSRTVLHAVRRAVADGALDAPVPESVSVERPRPGGCGDYATNVALRLAGPAHQPPRAVAEALRDRIAGQPGIASIEITGPGFLNITLHSRAQQELVDRVRQQGAAYGHSGQLAGVAVRFEAGEELRARVWADVLGRLLRSQGAETGHGEVERLHVVPAPDQTQDPAADATRWALLSAAAHDRPRTGPHLLVQHESNPLFTVRYAHARSRALSRNAGRLGIITEPAAEQATVDAPALTGAIGDHPAVLASAARLRAPDRLARHLEATADALLSFQHTVLPLGDEKPSAAHRSRLALAEAAGTVLAGGLSLLGISAPDYL
ncbi:ArgS-related anticodon-binding protein NrtL [Streptomyces sp. MS2.AVA.5]|uniref:DALR anticodon-binding domain-containing protein n=1 Tax=Streptomyces achmelvichensis TaxID=3134111 RepID=A0ACC6Q1I6_9ACTN